MDNKENLIFLISAITDAEIRLIRLDKERHKIIAELKFLKDELLKLSNSSNNISKNLVLRRKDHILNGSLTLGKTKYSKIKDIGLVGKFLALPSVLHKP